MKVRNILAFCLCTVVFLCTTACDPSHAANAPVYGSKSSAVSSLSSCVTEKKLENDVGSWVVKTPMSIPRKWFRTQVVNGKIYAMGGTDEYQGYSHGLSTVEEYDSKKNQWNKKTSMLTSRLDFQTEVIDGEIYVIGGFNGEGDLLSSVESYNPKFNKWTARASMSTARSDFQTEVVDGKIYAIGGIGNYAQFLTSVEEYDSKSNKWTTKSSMSVPRAQFQTIVMNGKIYAIGGNSDNKALLSVEEYDPKINNWIKKAPMSIPRIDFQAQSIAGKIYAIGGYNDGGGSTNTELPSVEEFDPESNRWVPKKPMHTPRHDFQTEVINGEIYTIGGSCEDQDSTIYSSGVSAVELYIPTDDVWLYEETMTTSRLFFQTAVLDNKIYAIGGTSKTKALSSVEAFTPWQKNMII